ncbi:acyl-CoA dehydrogenase [Nocardia sp. NPDC050799]|uniref:acyl-CoA dehydrogenase family protein n=1 Tax=Nocardia sp. NPDC050799 TaxID=3154842 RepID=UPI00340FFAA3
MDFRLDGEAADLYNLADTTLARQLPPERIAADSALSGGVASDAWTALIGAGVIDALLPEQLGGAGLDSYAAHAVVRAGAEHGSMVPTLPVVTAILVLSREPSSFGNLLRDVSAGRSLVTSAVREPGGRWIQDAVTTAVVDGEVLRLNGRKAFVQLGRQASHVLVPARTPEGIVIAVVPTDAEGITWAGHPVQSHVPAASMHLDEVALPATAVLGTPADGHARYLDRAMSISMCAAAAGTVHRALESAVEHVSARKQFGRAIGSFQAVKMQLADAYITSSALRSVADAAAWQLSMGHNDDVRRTVAAANYLMSRDLIPAVLACQHVLGGTGMDTDHPMHRFVITALDIANLLGGVEACLDRATAWSAADSTPYARAE